MNPLFDPRRPWPLLAVLVLHIGFFYASQAGLLRTLVETPAMKEIVATLIAPESPKPMEVEPPRPLPATRPATKVVTSQPVFEPPVNTMPSETAISLPAVVPPPPAPVAYTPAPPAVTQPVSAPAPAEPAPLIAPRFDAAYLNNPAPGYPTMARRMGDQGKVLLRVQVNAEGRAQEVQLKTSSGFPRLDEVALNTVREWRFVPARQGDQPVAAWVLVPIVFKLDG
jgi:protein TonB